MANAEALTWVLVCGGFRPDGGMDRANLALARYLAGRGEAVHLVTHDVDAGWVAEAAVQVTRVRRPYASSFAGEFALDRAARRVAARLRSSGRRVRLLGNGGSCTAADINWVHSVHHAWRCRDDGAPAWFRAKNRIYKRLARARERRAIAAADIVIANSERTAREVRAHLGVPDSRVHVVYLGTDPAWRPPDEAARHAARARWARDPSRPLVVFVGALGHDTNKGIDRLLDAWRLLHRRGWSGQLVVAGAGHAVWTARAADLAASVRFLGHVHETGDLMNAADLLVSPVVYEAYGLAAHEAICRGVPVITTATAGVVERLPASQAGLLLPEGAGPPLIADRILAWSAARDAWQTHAREASRMLGLYSEDDMAARLVAAVTGASR